MAKVTKQGEYCKVVDIIHVKSMSYLEDRQILGKVDLGMLRNGGRSDLTANWHPKGVES
jgi:hypothetical protein